MVTSSINSGETCQSQSSRFNRMDGRHVGTRTPDLYRVKLEVNVYNPLAAIPARKLVDIVPAVGTVLNLETSPNSHWW